MINIAVVDDEIQVLNKIQTILNKVPYLDEIDYKVTTYSDELKFTDDCKTKKFDLVLLDIEMPQMNGLDIGTFLRDNLDNAIIVFVTSYENYMMSSFGINVFAYVMKDTIDDTLPDVIIKVIDYIKKRKSLCIKTIDGIETVTLDEILYFMYSDRKIFFYSTDCNEKVVYEKSLKSLKKKYELTDFIQPCSQFLINPKYIKSIKNGLIAIDKMDIYIPISSRKTKTVIDQYKNYHLNKADLLF